jgi:hypothetical protein
VVAGEFWQNGPTWLKAGVTTGTIVIIIVTILPH